MRWHLTIIISFNTKQLILSIILSIKRLILEVRLYGIRTHSLSLQNEEWECRGVPTSHMRHLQPANHIPNFRGVQCVCTSSKADVNNNHIAVQKTFVMKDIFSIGFEPII